MPIPAAAATHLFEYVLPSQPQTGLYSFVQAVGRFMHVASASAAPHEAPTSYAQYSSAAQVLPANPPHALPHAAVVQFQLPPMQTQLLQSCIIVSPSLHAQAFCVQSH